MCANAICEGAFTSINCYIKHVAFLIFDLLRKLILVSGMPSTICFKPPRSSVNLTVLDSLTSGRNTVHSWPWRGDIRYTLTYTPVVPSRRYAVAKF